jgi:hypothetical protein
VSIIIVNILPLLLLQELIFFSITEKLINGKLLIGFFRAIREATQNIKPKIQQHQLPRNSSLNDLIAYQGLIRPSDSSGAGTADMENQSNNNNYNHDSKAELVVPLDYSGTRKSRQILAGLSGM